jgi:hypothetical protein
MVHGARQTVEEGWRQILAGLALIDWSRLASWDKQKLSLVAARESDVFESAVGTVHPIYGRLICWIALGVGGEYLFRGAFMLKGHDPTRHKEVIQPPEQGENIAAWVQRVKNKDASIRKPGTESRMKFGGDPPWEKILTPGLDLDLVSASMKLLAGKIRNRDAHHYAENVRAFHFHVVESLFVPAFNILLKALDQGELRQRSIGLPSRTMICFAAWSR